MPTYFSTYDGNFSSGLATVVGDVSAGGTNGIVLGTTYTYPNANATSPGATFTGVAFQLSAVLGAPTGTIDLILSGNNGSSVAGLFPVAGLAKARSSNNITPNYSVGWQYFLFDTPITFPNGTAIRIGYKTSVADKVSFVGANINILNRAYVTTLTGNPNNSSDIVHIVGALTTSGLVTRTVNYNIASNTVGNFYIHNGGVLNFDPNIDIDLTLAGSLGMQITPNGTINIGTSSTPVLSSKVHKINLNNNYVNVHNGAFLNTYGAPKTQYALISADTVVGTQTYPTVTDISNWINNTSTPSNADAVVISPNTSILSSIELTYIYTKNTNGSVIVWNAAAYTHNSSTYIPSIVNMTRNVRFEGINTTFGYIRFLDGSISNLNNTQFKGFRNSTYKGLQFCTNSTGSVSLSNCTFNGDGVASMPVFSFDATKTPASNISIRGCNFFGYGTGIDTISLSAVSANNFIFTDNIVLSGSQNGMLVDRLSSTHVNIKNNFLIGNRQNGLRVSNNYILSGAVGGIGCMNGVCGSVVTGTSGIVINYDGLAGHYNRAEGVNISNTLIQLSSTIFSNITASNNATAGFELSGSANLNSPTRLNINNLVANNNSGAGFEAYAITGNLSSFSLRSNLSGNLYISIGNGNTIFDGVTSTNATSVSSQTSNIHILSGLNYGVTVFKNSLLLGDRVNAIRLNSTKFEQFYIDSSVLSSNRADIGTSSSTNLLEGSYHFNNCTFGSGILSSNISDYQSEIFTESGFAVMKENGIPNKHYRLLKAGKISLDTTLAKSPNTVSEKLEPASSTTKLRCGSKMVPVNKDDSYTISCYVYKSNGYSGAAPRLILRRNAALGYSDTILATSTGVNETWDLLSGTLSPAADTGIFEVYVDCSGTAGCGSVNIDSWSLS